MIAKDIKKGDQFWSDGKLVWTAFKDANIVTIDGEELAAVPVTFSPDGGRDYRYFDLEQEVKVKRGD